MQLDAKDIILFLLGVLQAWFFYDKSRTATEVKELRDGLKAMMDVIHKIEKDLTVARYALFEDKRKGRNNSND